MSLFIQVSRTLTSVLLVGAGAACSDRSGVEQVPVGSRVEVTRDDGGVVRGRLTARDARTVEMTVGPAARSISRDQIASVAIINGTTAPPLPAVAMFREFTLPAGTVLAARLGSSVGSDTSHAGDTVEATLTEAARVDDIEVLPEGSVITGVVTSAEPSGKVKGRASLTVEFRSISVAGRAAAYPVSASLTRTAASTTTSDVKKIGIPAAGGAVVGAIIGGKKGAGIGAIIGGGAGTAVVLTTAGPEVGMSSGTVLSISLDEAVDVRVPITR